MAIQIETGVPIPPVISAAPRRTVYPFKEMKAGDSFVVLLADSRSTSLGDLQNALFQCARAAIGPHKIATRKLPDGSGFRVWRTA